MPTLLPPAPAPPVSEPRHPPRRRKKRRSQRNWARNSKSTAHRRKPSAAKQTPTQKPTEKPTTKNQRLRLPRRSWGKLNHRYDGKVEVGAGVKHPATRRKLCGLISPPKADDETATATGAKVNS